jgi:DNA-binding MurR/RpiR family transcriptional regulator
MASKRSVSKVKKLAAPPAEPPEAADINYALHIQSAFDSMPKSYKKIAHFLLDKPDSAKSMSITQLSDKLGVCASTITRFSQSLGFSGYPQLKYDIVRSSRLPIDHDEFITGGDSTAAVMRKLNRMYSHSIESIGKMVDLAALDLVANIITKAAKIYLFGHGGSGVSVTLGQLLFMQIGLPAVGFTEISTATMAATQMREGDIAIGISSSGVAKTAVDSLRQADACGAFTVGVTGYPHSPLASFSKILFCYNYSKEDMRLMHIARVCETIILGMLQNCILNKHYGKLSVSLAQAKETIMNMRYT